MRNYLAVNGQVGAMLNTNDDGFSFVEFTSCKIGLNLHKTSEGIYLDTSIRASKIVYLVRTIISF